MAPTADGGPPRTGLQKSRGTAPPAVADGSEDELILNRGDANAFAVKVDRRLTAALREHQREGLQFMYNCTMGRRLSVDGAPLSGCILAHSMGLGKTLQALALLHTVLRTGPRNVPLFKKPLVVCPASLCKNWRAEFSKWFPVGSTSLRPLVLPPLKADAQKAVRGPPEEACVRSRCQAICAPSTEPSPPPPSA